MSSAPFVRGYLHQELVSSLPGLSAVRTGKTENQIGFSISALKIRFLLIEKEDEYTQKILAQPENFVNK